MSYNAICPCNKIGDHGKIIWVFKQSAPPVIFIDNQFGYLPVEWIPLSRSGESLSYGNTKYCMGYTFYSTDESIGVGIVKNGAIYSIVDTRVEDFFHVTFSDNSEYAETSLLCAVALDFDRIYVAAIMNYGGSAYFASKIVSARSLAISLKTFAIPAYATDSTIQKHSSMFDEYGKFIGNSNASTKPGPGDMVAAYETYSGSYGFSDVSVVPSVTGKSSDVTSVLFSLIGTQISNLGGPPINKSISMIYAPFGDRLLLCSTDGEHINIFVYDGSWENIVSEQLSIKSCSKGSDNVYEGNLFFVPNMRGNGDNNYSKIYAPTSIIFRYKYTKNIVLSLPADSGIVSYNFKADKNNSKIIVEKDKKGKVLQSDTYSPQNAECDKMAYMIHGNRIKMNIDDGDDIVAQYVGTKVTQGELGIDSKGVRSMSVYIPYGSLSQ